MPQNEDEGIRTMQPRTVEERMEMAASMRDALELTFPVVVDFVDDAVMNAYGAWPERLYVVGADGRIAYRGKQGPFGFDTAELEAFLAGHYPVNAAAP